MQFVRASLSRLVFKAAIFRRRYSKAAGSRPIAFRGSKRFETDYALNGLHARLACLARGKQQKRRLISR